MFYRKPAIVSWASFCFLALLSGSIGFAQTSDAEIAGSIKDPSGTAVPSAKVTLTNQDSGITHNIAADAEGRYRFAIPPGKYSLRIEAAGFRTETITDLVLNVGMRFDKDVALTVGNVQ